MNKLVLSKKGYMDDNLNLLNKIEIFSMLGQNPTIPASYIEQLQMTMEIFTKKPTRFFYNLRYHADCESWQLDPAPKGYGSSVTALNNRYQF